MVDRRLDELEIFPRALPRLREHTGVEHKVGNFGKAPDVLAANSRVRAMSASTLTRCFQSRKLHSPAVAS